MGQGLCRAGVANTWRPPARRSDKGRSVDVPPCLWRLSSFPSIEGNGFKVVPTFEPVLVDPHTQEHSLTAEELRKGRAFAAKWFPALANQPLVDSEIVCISIWS